MHAQLLRIIILFQMKNVEQKKEGPEFTSHSGLLLLIPWKKHVTQRVTLQVFDPRIENIMAGRASEKKTLWK